MIKSIYLENWKTHHQNHLEFVKGTNVIVGKMGAGKSSVTDAICFALYGTFPSLNARKVSLDETIMAKPFRAEKSVVKMEFDYNKKEYFVERTLKRNGINEASLKENGKTIAGPKTSEVTKKIEEILEVNYDLFSRAIYSEQNQIDFFLKLSPAQRKEKFDELLGLDKYERVRTNAVTLTNRIKKMAEDRKSLLMEHKKRDTEKELVEREKKILEKEKEAAEKKVALEETEKRLKQKDEKFREQEKKEREHRLLKELEIKTKSRTEALKEDIQKIGKQIGEKKATEKELREKQKENSEIEEKTLKAEKNAKETMEKISKARQRLAVQKNLLESNARAAKETGKLGSECPVCKRPLEEHDKKKLEKELEGQKREITAKIREIQEEAERNEKELEEHEKEKEAHKKAKKKTEQELEETKKIFEAAKEAEAKEKQKSALEKELKQTLEMIRKTGFDEKEMAGQREEMALLREKKAKASSEISAASELLKQMRDNAEMMKRGIEQAKELEKTIKANETAVEKLALFTQALKATQAELRNAMIETINDAMDEIWEKVYPYKDFTSAKIIVDEGSYEIMARQRNGEWIRVEGILSGGERTAAAITIRIAVSLVLTQNLGWIMLDEPTHNLDSNAVRELSEMMRNHLPELIEQIFVITHDKEMENAASGKLYVLEREKESDGTTKISGA